MTTQNDTQYIIVPEAHPFRANLPPLAWKSDYVHMKSIYDACKMWMATSPLDR